MADEPVQLQEAKTENIQMESTRTDRSSVEEGEFEDNTKQAGSALPKESLVKEDLREHISEDGAGQSNPADDGSSMSIGREENPEAGKKDSTLNMNEKKTVEQDEQSINEDQEIHSSMDIDGQNKLSMDGIDSTTAAERGSSTFSMSQQETEEQNHEILTERPDVSNTKESDAKDDTNSNEVVQNTEHFSTDEPDNSNVENMAENTIGNDAHSKTGVNDGKNEREVEPEYNEDFEDSGQSSTYDLDTITQRQQEEREAFQKLIDECSHLELKIKQLEQQKDEMETKHDIMTIELETEKEKTSELKEQIKDLETTLASLSAPQTVSSSRDKLNESLKIPNGTLAQKRNEGESEAPNHPVEISDEKSEHDSSIKEYQLKIKRMTQDDETNSKRIAKLEEEVDSFHELISDLEKEIGVAKLDEIRSKSKRTRSHQSVRNGYSNERTNTVNPEPSRKSGVCNIL